MNKTKTRSVSGEDNAGDLRRKGSNDNLSGLMKGRGRWQSRKVGCGETDSIKRAAVSTTGQKVRKVWKDAKSIS